MKLVRKEDIENWARRIDSKGNLPWLILKLVRSTTPLSTRVNIPSGSAAYMGGWDGIVICETKTSYVPKDVSLWELGTEGNPKIKAEEDFKKRSKDPLGFNPKECIFIFVTPRIWKKKADWIKEKKAEDIWKDVRVYDCIDLEQWLETSTSVSRWFSSHVGTFPYDGIMTTEEYWEEWSIGPNGLKLIPEIVTIGREFQQEQILLALQGLPTLRGIRASTKKEAIAFIIATAMQFPKDEFETFFSKSLIVDTEGNFRAIRINQTSPLNLIPSFDDVQPLYAAVSKGHHVLVPLGADDSFNQETITLPILDRDGQINSLIKCGISKEDAEKFSRESGRNITILKKLMGLPSSNAKWIDTEDIREIIPALLIGRWNESFEGDIELIEKLSKSKYEDYLRILFKWRDIEESPIIQIGETWRLTSPLDLWSTLSAKLTKNDFENLKECFSLAFKSGNPILIPKDQDYFFAQYNQKRKFSNWSREGLTQSLILVGRFGESLTIPNLINLQNWVDEIIFDLLNNANFDLWISVDNELPLISEASPLSFIKSVNISLAHNNSPIIEMFNETDGIIHATSHHTGLLWALEGLAWMPEYLKDVSLILLVLTRLDPGGRLINRPINSLIEIYKPWHYQTLSPFEERMNILNLVTKKEPQTGWKLLMGLLPEHHAIAHPTHKMRWRMFDKNTNLIYTYEEIWKTHSFVISLIIQLFDYTENNFSEIINESVSLSSKDRNTILGWAMDIYENIDHKEFIAWHAIRKILHHHQSYPEADWTIPENDLRKYETLYNKLQPKDPVSQYLWLFNEHWPSFPEAEKESDYAKRKEVQEKRIEEYRKKAVILFLKELGLEKTIQLRKSLSELWAFGFFISEVVKNENKIELVAECLNDDKPFLNFIYGFYHYKFLFWGLDWIKDNLSQLQSKGYSNKALSQILIPLDQSGQLWNYVETLNEEIQEEYWNNIYPRFYRLSIEEKITGIKRLLKYMRFYSALEVCSHFPEEMPTELMVELLKKAATEKASEPIQIRGYEIERIFEILDVRADLDHPTIINLEWLYLPLLDSYGITRNPKVLQDELSKSPKFFVDVLKWMYIPEDENRIEEEKKGISEEALQNRAYNAYHLLNSWKKIPGVKSDNSINKTELIGWINQARQIATNESRIEAAERHIGKVLAQYPENVPEWPPEAIFEIIEEISSISLNSSYSSALFNKRGSSSRGPFDGGEIERGHAIYFESLAKKYKNKYSQVSEIFQHLAEGYLIDAKRMDEEAERSKLEY